MASKNIQIKAKNGAVWDDLFPKTKASIVMLLDGTTSVETKLSALDTLINGKATPADITNAINSLVNASPATLDTLNELAVALGNDANFATTMTNALAGKAPLASPTFTGTVNGITKSMVGLSNVDNTSDANKPVSTAQQTALTKITPVVGTVDPIATADWWYQEI